MKTNFDPSTISERSDDYSPSELSQHRYLNLRPIEKYQSLTTVV